MTAIPLKLRLVSAAREEIHNRSAHFPIQVRKLSQQTTSFKGTARPAANMSRRTIYTIITPLPSTVSRRTAINALHNHSGMIELSPIVLKHGLTKAPGNAPPDEYHCTWYSITDRVSYLPGGMVKGQVTYKVCFHDLPSGMQSHVYAPAGLDIKGKWSVGGNEPGEEREVRELGLVGVPREGLYLREDIDMRCNFLLTSFVKKTLKKTHEVLVDRLVERADLHDDAQIRQSYATPHSNTIGHSLASPTSASSRSSSTRVGSGSAKYEMPGSPPYPDEVKRTALRDSRMSYSTSASSPPPSTRSTSVRSDNGPFKDQQRLSMPRAPNGPSSAIGAQAYIAELPTSEDEPAAAKRAWPATTTIEPPEKNPRRSSQIYAHGLQISQESGQGLGIGVHPAMIQRDRTGSEASLPPLRPLYQAMVGGRRQTERIELE